MMTYTFEIVELDASGGISQLPNEPEQEFLERVAAADGMNFFAVTVIGVRNGRAQRRISHSPYFKADSNPDRFSKFKEAMKLAGQQICEHEAQLPPDEGPQREPLIVVP